MKRSDRTGLGVSNETYSEGPEDYQIAGEIQEKADNPALFTASSSGILKTHAALAPGLELHGCFRERMMKRHNVSYVDDNDGNVSADYNSERPMDELIEKMRLSSKTQDMERDSNSTSTIFWSIISVSQMCMAGIRMAGSER